MGGSAAVTGGVVAATCLKQHPATCTQLSPDRDWRGRGRRCNHGRGRCRHLPPGSMCAPPGPLLRHHLGIHSGLQAPVGGAYAPVALCPRASCHGVDLVPGIERPWRRWPWPELLHVGAAQSHAPAPCQVSAHPQPTNEACGQKATRLSAASTSLRQPVVLSFLVLAQPVQGIVQNMPTQPCPFHGRQSRQCARPLDEVHCVRMQQRRGQIGMKA